MRRRAASSRGRCSPCRKRMSSRGIGRGRSTRWGRWAPRSRGPCSPPHSSTTHSLGRGERAGHVQRVSELGGHAEMAADGRACACVRGKVAPQRPWPEHPAGQARCEQSSPDQPAWQMHLVSTQWPAPEHSLGQVAMEQSAPRHDGWQTHVPFCVHAVSFTVCHSQCQLERGAPSTRAHTPGSSRGASSPRGR